MQRNSGQPIVIAGAGPVGLFAAVLLINAGRRVIVLEKNDGLPMDMRASTFHPATLDLLHSAGLADALILRGSIRQGWQYMIHGTKQHAVFDLDCISDMTGFPFRLLCEQFHFTNIAVEYLVRKPLFEIRFGHKILRVDQQSDGVTVLVQSAGETHEISTPWLIAADGKSSTVRKQLSLGFESSSVPTTSITLVLNHPFQDDIPGLLGVNYVWTEKGYYSLRQIRDLWRFSYPPDPSLYIDEALSPEAAQSSVQAVFPRTEPYELLQCKHHTLHQGCMDSFRSGRVLFAGDAAHLDSPAGGMGMNAGIHDAQCLVDHLVAVLDGAEDRLLDRYSRRRRTIVLEEIQRLAARNDRWRRETDPHARAAIWAHLQEVVSSKEKTREFLLDSSMIRSVRREKEID
jgi:2-polyprenyl-6-methoxyphenol hydroxylase-like FAD-dependent oxidoreductase